MALYYDGDLEKDLERVKNEPFWQELDNLGRQMGYGRAQQTLQILWAAYLREKGLPTNGALYR